jgi:hypothetical protein
MTAALLRAMPLIPGIAGTRPDVTLLGGVPLLVNCAAGKLVAVTWTEKAEAVMAAALSTLAMAACGRPWW